MHEMLPELIQLILIPFGICFFMAAIYTIFASFFIQPKQARAPFQALWLLFGGSLLIAIAVIINQLQQLIELSRQLV
jgi:uncharacterized membrane protein